MSRAYVLLTVESGEEDNVLDELEKIKDVEKSYENVLKYATNIFNIIYDKLQTKHISKRDWAKSIVVDCGGISSTDFDISNRQKDALVQSGWEAAMRFLGK